MKLIMTLLVRDEQEILETNLEYHFSMGIDFVIATDNRSRDSTPAILEQYRDAGMLHYLYEEQDDYSQFAWVTRMARMARTEFGADWVINNDADEFWWPVSGDLKDVLANQSSTCDGLICQRSNFVYLGDAPEQRFWERQIYRQANSTNPFGKPLPPKVCHRAHSEIQVKQGNHSVSFEHRPARLESTSDILVFHYPIHGAAHFKNKIMTGGRAYDRNPELRNRVGKFWLQMYLASRRDPAALDRYLNRQSYDAEQITQAVRRGELIRDCRLRDYLMGLRPGNRRDQ